MATFANSAKMLQKAFFLQTYHFMNTRPGLWVPALICAVLAGISIGVACMYFIASHPYAGEIFRTWMIETFLFILSLLAACFALVIAHGFWRSAGEINRDMPVEATATQRLMGWLGMSLASHALLSWTPPYAEKDVLICSLPGESEADFKARALAAAKASSPANWAVILTKGDPVGHLFAGPHDFKSFPRTEPPFQGPHWAEHERIAPANARFVGESDEQFQAYVDAFMMHFPEWAATKKYTAAPDKSGDIFLRSLQTLAFLLLFIPAMSGQKIEQVTEALGTRIREIPAAGSAITYSFETSDVMRKGDGKSGYVDLLKAVPNFRNAGGGKFLFLSCNDAVVCRGNSVQSVAAPKTKAEAMRPNLASVPEEQQSFSMPDSAEMADMADRAKYEIWKAQKMIGAASRPWWEVFMYAFGVALPLFIIGIFVLRFAAGFFASEGMLVQHKVARAWLATLVVITIGVGLLEVLLLSMWAGFHPVALCVVAIAASGFATEMAKRLVPDFRPAAGNSPVRRNTYNDGPQLLN